MVVLIIAYLAMSCRNEENGLPDYNENKLFKVAINFSTVSTRSSSSNVTERIKTFRIIITSYENQEVESETDTDTETNGAAELREIVQLNKFVTEENLASTFNYFLIWHTNEGIKNFYLFANEESVGTLSYSNINSDETNMSNLLDSYTEGTDASDLKSLLTSAYFTPIYEINSSGSIYLPYTAIYEGIEVKDNSTNLEMFLVPVATKFIFNFINYRPAEVYIQGISVNSTNTENYLIANVGDANMQMTLPGATSSIYWVDWLAKVSELSQNNTEFSSNQSFNMLYGWIWDYDIPTSGINDPYVFLPTDNQLQIPGGSVSPDISDSNGEEVAIIPGKCTAGPFYVPESKVNIVEETNSTGTVIRQTQKYYLTIGLADSDPDNKDVPDFSNVEIDNLKALFRNTSVIINFVMKQGDVEIYAQIAPWTEQQSFGYVNEGNKPDFLK